MGTEDRHAVLAHTLTLLTKGSSIETELAFLDSLSCCVKTAPVNQQKLKTGSPVQNGEVTSGPVGVSVAEHFDNSGLQSQIGNIDNGKITQGTKRQNKSTASGCGNGVENVSVIAHQGPQVFDRENESGVSGTENRNNQPVCVTEFDNTQEVPSEKETTYVDISLYNGHSDGVSVNGSCTLSEYISDLSLLCCDRDLAADFVEYVFTRRYGRADKEILEDETGALARQTVNVDPQLEESLNEKMDAVINRIMEQPVTTEMASAFDKLLRKAASMPTLRYRTVEHLVVWLSGIGNCKVDDNTYKTIKSLILTGVTDVWSAVRKSCSSGLPYVFCVWNQQQQQDFFSYLLEICINTEASWQAKDGAALCVNAIMNKCFPRRNQMRQVSFLKQKEELPSFIVECVLTIVFSLISHPQLSIRETVAKIMSNYMEHVDNKDMVDLLHQPLVLLTPASSDSNTERFQCVDAYAAEGLLNICISIFRVLPVRQAVQLWPTYRETFLSYLTHNASSVRQTSSSLFLCLASKPEGSAVLMKVVLDHLVRGWQVPADAVSLCTDFVQDVRDGLTSWEAREGRMFVYELLCKHLIENHLQTAQSAAQLEEFDESLGLTGSSGETAVYRQIADYFKQQSSLSQLKLLDDPQDLANILGTQVMSDTELQTLQWWLLLHYSSEAESKEESLPWIKEIHLPRFRELLLTMLHHTALCLAHTQWELRRIAQQVLPQLCEVICLFDVDLMLTVWQYMSEEANLWSFLGLYTLHESLTHCAHVVATADLSDQTAALKDSVYVKLVDGVRKHVEDYLPLVCCHLRRPVFDKMSVTAVETALLSVNFFDLEESLKQDLCQAVLTLWMNLFIFAHPNNAISNSLFDSPALDFVSPYEGFLSCCLVRPESKIQCARQVEKTMIFSIHKHLGHFLPQLDIEGASLCLPLLAHNIAYFIDDTEVCKSLINSFGIVCQCTSMSLSSALSNADEGDSFDKPLKCVYFALRELCAVIAMKSLDLMLLQKVLGCYAILCRLLNPSVHLPLLLKGVCARLNEPSKPFHLDSSHNLDPGVELRWHKAEMALGAGDQSGDSSTLDTSLGHEQSETESLNQSGSSYGARLCPRMGRRRTLSVSGDALMIHEVANQLSGGESAAEDAESESSGSDWDSWSEEENDEEISAVKLHFQDFFKQILAIYGHECFSLLETEKRHLPKKDQDLLASLFTGYSPYS